MVARRAREGKILGGLERVLDLFDKTGRNRLVRLAGKVGPDFSEVGFRRLGQTERERLANSFLPRAITDAGSKSFTRPAATSASPLSMSDFSASSSCR